MADWVALAVVAQLLRLVLVLLETILQPLSFATLVDVELLSIVVAGAAPPPNGLAAQQWLDTGLLVPHHVAIELVAPTSNWPMAPQPCVLKLHNG